MSQRDLADSVGLDQSAISRIENGQRAVGVGELLEIAASLGVEPTALLADEPSRPFDRVDATGDGDLAVAVAKMRDVIQDFEMYADFAR